MPDTHDFFPPLSYCPKPLWEGKERRGCQPAIQPVGEPCITHTLVPLSSKTWLHIDSNSQHFQLTFFKSSSSTHLPDLPFVFLCSSTATTTTTTGALFFSFLFFSFPSLSFPLLPSSLLYLPLLSSFLLHSHQLLSSLSFIPKPQQTNNNSHIRLFHIASSSRQLPSSFPLFTPLTELD